MLRICASVGAGVVLGALITASLSTTSASAKSMRVHHHQRHQRAAWASLANQFAVPLLSEAQQLSELRKAQPDIATALPIRWLQDRSNPCFVNGTRTRCLPAFFLGGAMQCGSGDLWKRLREHGLIVSKHDALSHWWTLHPRSIAHGRFRDFNQYLDLFSTAPTLAALEAQPEALLGEASPASFSFMMAEQLRLHYLYLDAFGTCYGGCRSPSCKSACYERANAATVSLSFNLPSLIATTFGITRLPKMVALLRDPAVRLWIAFFTYGQYPARYGGGTDGFRAYFGNQSAAFHTCVQTNGRGRRKCALRFEAYGAAEASVYYHCDQLIKGMCATMPRALGISRRHPSCRTVCATPPTPSRQLRLPIATRAVTPLRPSHTLPLQRAPYAAHRYAAFLPEWQAALGPNRLLIIRTEDHVAQPLRTVHRVQPLAVPMGVPVTILCLWRNFLHAAPAGRVHPYCPLA